jgi:hypothetical protein
MLFRAAPVPPSLISKGKVTGESTINEVGAFGPVPCDHADRLERSLR